MSKRIGITQRVTHLADINETRDCLDQSWTTLLTGCGFQPILLPNRLPEPGEYVRSLQLGGIIFSGGNDLCVIESGRNHAPERDSLERTLLTHCIEHRLPLLGVCRGMQMLLAEDGVMPAPLSDHVATTHRLSRTAESPLPLPGTFTTNSYHDFGFAELPESCAYTCIARASDNSVEAIVHDDHPFVAGIMWHPERQPDTELNHAILDTMFA